MRRSRGRVLGPILIAGLVLTGTSGAVAESDAKRFPTLDSLRDASDLIVVGQVTAVEPGEPLVDEANTCESTDATVAISRRLRARSAARPWSSTTPATAVQRRCWARGSRRARRCSSWSRSRPSASTRPRPRRSWGARRTARSRSARPGTPLPPRVVRPPVRGAGRGRGHADAAPDGRDRTDPGPARTGQPGAGVARPPPSRLVARLTTPPQATVRSCASRRRGRRRQSRSTRA